jgi:hypothetical protein
MKYTCGVAPKSKTLTRFLYFTNRTRELIDYCFPSGVRTFVKFRLLETEADNPTATQNLFITAMVSIAREIEAKSWET